jgi:enoyl-CoA hydratase/carnithine racemase
VPTTLELDRPHPHTVVVRFNRPERLNAINATMVRELQDAYASVRDDPAVRVVVLTGAGRGFCSGIDVRDFGAFVPGVGDPTAERLRFQEMMAGLATSLRGLPQPVIAAVNGPAVGGGFALCLASDVRICAAAASFGNGAIRIGLSGGEMGMSYHLPRIVGTSVAADWMLTGRMVPADEALRVGLVSDLVPDDQLLDRALALADQIAANSAVAVTMTKRVLQVNADAPNLDAAMELENRNQLLTHATEESAAAIAKWSRQK